MGQEDTIILHKNQISLFLQYLFNIEYYSNEKLSQAISYLPGINKVSIDSLVMNHHISSHQEYTCLIITYSNWKMMIRKSERSYVIMLRVLYIPHYKYFTQCCKCHCNKKRVAKLKEKKETDISITISYPSISISVTKEIEPLPPGIHYDDICNISKLYDKSKNESNNILRRNTINTTTPFPFWMKTNTNPIKDNGTQHSMKGKDFDEIYDELLLMREVKIAEMDKYYRKNPHIAALFPKKDK